MKSLNKLSLFFLVILVIIIPIIVITLNKSTTAKIEENAENAQNYAKVTAERASKLEEEYTAISNEIPGIVCIGSNSMSGSGAISATLPSELSNKITDNGYKIPIVNLAVSGENTLTVLGRLGVIPFVVGETVTIPAESGLIDFKLKSSEDGYVWPLAIPANNANFNPVTIDGYTGNIGGESIRDTKTGENKHYFVRIANGEPFTLQAGSIINTSCDDEYKDYVHIIWLGENDEWLHYNDLVNYIKQVIDASGKNKDRYLVLGIPKGSTEAMEEYDKLMKEEFNTHYLNVREYLSSYDLRTTSIRYSDADLEQQEKGIVPSCMLNDFGELNDSAYKLLTNYVYDALISNDCIKKP